MVLAQNPLEVNYPHASTPDAEPWTYEYPLIMASKLCHNDMLDMLIAAKANLNVTDKRGWTALHWAAVMNNINAAQVLCKAGADVRPRTNGGKTVC
jgi:ankyrin repeat protein